MVSIVCAIKNRLKTLKVSLASWLVAPGIDEIVIVDWSSDEPLASFAAQDSRIKIIRVDNEPEFHLSAAFNLAADHANSDVLLKLDADYVLNPFYDFVGSLLLPANTFITGHFQHGGPFLAYLNGLIYIRKEHWQRVHGYNEHMIRYGWDDVDFYDRLVKSGVQRQILTPPPVLVFHIPHNDDFRGANYANKNLLETHLQNKEIANRPYTARKYSWALTPTGPQTLVAEKRLDAI